MILVSSAQAADGHPHTLVGARGGGALFNVPLLSSGQPDELRLREAYGVVILGCNVHRDEEKSRLVVLAHPFHAFSDGEGQFRLSGVPAGQLRVAPIPEAGSPVEVAIDLEAGGASEVCLTAAE